MCVVDLNTGNLLFGPEPGARAGSPWGCGVDTLHPSLQSFHPCLSAGNPGLLPVAFTVGDVRPQRDEWHTVQYILRNARHIGCSHAVLKSKSPLGASFVLSTCKHCVLSSFHAQIVIRMWHQFEQITLYRGAKYIYCHINSWHADASKAEAAHHVLHGVMWRWATAMENMSRPFLSHITMKKCPLSRKPSRQMWSAAWTLTQIRARPLFNQQLCDNWLLIIWLVGK